MVGLRLADRRGRRNDRSGGILPDKSGRYTDLGADRARLRPAVRRRGTDPQKVAAKAGYSHKLPRGLDLRF